MVVLFTVGLTFPLKEVLSSQFLEKERVHLMDVIKTWATEDSTYIAVA